MRLKSVLLASAAGFVVAPVANAADLPLRTKAPLLTPMPVASWQGWYAGIHLGAARVGGDSWEPGDTNHYGSRGTVFIGGGQLGYNWQSGNFVYGWEADGSGLTTYKVDQTDCCIDYGQYGNNISWLSTIRGRMGLAIGDTMVYGTAGLAIGGVKNTQFVNGDNYYSSSKTRLGWAVGGGIEHMVSRNWTVGLEAMFVDLGNSKGPCDPAGIKCSKFSNDAVIARFKANYKF